MQIRSRIGRSRRLGASVKVQSHEVNESDEVQLHQPEESHEVDEVESEELEAWDDEQEKGESEGSSGEGVADMMVKA